MTIYTCIQEKWKGRYNLNINGGHNDYDSACEKLKISHIWFQCFLNAQDQTVHFNANLYKNLTQLRIYNVHVAGLFFFCLVYIKNKLIQFEVVFEQCCRVRTGGLFIIECVNVEICLIGHTCTQYLGVLVYKIAIKKH